MTTNNQTLSSTAIENVQSIGEGSIEMHGYTVENKPDIPYIEVRFFTKMAVSLLFSQGKTEGQRKGAEKKRFIHGADWFNSKIYTIIEAIKADDPFADQMLFNVEQSIQALGNELAEVKKYLLKSLEKRLGESNAKVTFNSNMHTITANITYENRISYDLLWALKEVDAVFYYLYLNEKYSAMLPADCRTIRDETRIKFRNCMTQINNWVSTSITREDIAQNTRRVQLSYEQNSRVGLSREVLLMEQRAISAPLIPVHHNGNLDPVIIEKIKTLYNF